MGQAGAAVQAQAAPREDSFVFDMRNGLRVWLSEAVKRGEVTEAKAVEVIRNIDAEKAVDVTEDQAKLWIGPIKDGFGAYGIGKKLVTDFNKWWGVRVYFKAGPKGDLVIIKGWPNGRQLLKGTKYRVDNIKIMELQIGKPGIMAAAKDSAKFGLVLVVLVDLFQFTQDRNFAHLLASLTLDVPSVALASALGAAIGSLATGVAVVGTFALGPALVAFGVGVAVGAGLFWLDKHYGLNEKVTAAYQRGLDRLARWWRDMGAQAERKWSELVNSNAVHQLERGLNSIGETLGSGNNAQYMLQSLM